MFDDLTAKLNGILRKVTGRGKLSPENIEQAIQDVRMALLEADVNYRVVRDFLKRVAERSLGVEVHRSLNPGQQFIKIVQEELTDLMGASDGKVIFSPRPPTVMMIAGLQGSGKTTSAAKMAALYKKKGHRPLLVAADVYRPAAVEQLRILGGQIGVPVYGAEGGDPVTICREALDKGRAEGFDLLLLDTAGRLHIDDALMTELQRIKEATAPQEILLVADAMTGQDAVNVARAFNERLELSGVVLTKLDGDARGGAALSIRYVTGKPVKFVGTGEKMDQLEVFHPDRMASRILGMGDLLTLIEKAQSAYDADQAVKLEEKLRKQRFTLNDFLDHLRKVRKMGSLEQLMKLIPGLGAMPDLQGAQPDEKELSRIEAMIFSMTPAERESYQLINGSRRKRIARGSGTSVQEINRLLQQFAQMQKMLQGFARGGVPATPAGFAGLARGLGPGMGAASRGRKRPKKKRRIRR